MGKDPGKMDEKRIERNIKLAKQMLEHETDPAEREKLEEDLAKLIRDQNRIGKKTAEVELEAAETEKEAAEIKKKSEKQQESAWRKLFPSYIKAGQEMAEAAKDIKKVAKTDVKDIYAKGKEGAGKGLRSLGKKQLNFWSQDVNGTFIGKKIGQGSKALVHGGAGLMAGLAGKGWGKAKEHLWPKNSFDMLIWLGLIMHFFVDGARYRYAVTEYSVAIDFGMFLLVWLVFFKRQMKMLPIAFFIFLLEIGWLNRLLELGVTSNATVGVFTTYLVAKWAWPYWTILGLWYGEKTEGGPSKLTNLGWLILIIWWIGLISWSAIYGFAYEESSEQVMQANEELREQWEKGFIVGGKERQQAREICVARGESVIWIYLRIDYILPSECTIREETRLIEENRIKESKERILEAREEHGGRDYTTVIFEELERTAERTSLLFSIDTLYDEVDLKPYVCRVKKGASQPKNDEVVDKINAGITDDRCTVPDWVGKTAGQTEISKVTDGYSIAKGGLRITAESPEGYFPKGKNNYNFYVYAEDLKSTTNLDLIFEGSRKLIEMRVDYGEKKYADLLKSIEGKSLDKIESKMIDYYDGLMKHNQFPNFILETYPNKEIAGIRQKKPAVADMSIRPKLPIVEVGEESQITLIIDVFNIDKNKGFIADVKSFEMIVPDWLISDGECDLKQSINDNLDTINRGDKESQHAGSCTYIIDVDGFNAEKAKKPNIPLKKTISAVIDYDYVYKKSSEVYVV